MRRIIHLQYTCLQLCVCVDEKPTITTKHPNLKSIKTIFFCNLKIYFPLKMSLTLCHYLIEFLLLFIFLFLHRLYGVATLQFFRKAATTTNKYSLQKSLCIYVCVFMFHLGNKSHAALFKEKNIFIFLLFC